MTLLFYILTLQLTPTSSLEQMEQDKLEHDTSKVPTPPNETNPTHATPPPPKNDMKL